MRYARAVLTLSTVLFVLVQSASANESDIRTRQLDSVPALDKPVTLTVRAATIKEVLAKIQQLTGARLRPSRDVAEHKTTIRVKDRPAREVLREIARCFDLGWSEEKDDNGTYLSLWMDRRSLENANQRQLEDYLAITRQFDEQMRATSALAAAGIKFSLPDDAIEQMTMDEYDRLRLREAATLDPQQGASVLQYLKLTEAQHKDIIAGKHVIVSGTAIASDALAKCPESQSFEYWVDPSLGGYLLKCLVQPNDSEVLLATAVFDDSRYDKTIDAANVLLAKDALLDKELAVPSAAQGIPATSVAKRKQVGPIVLGPKLGVVAHPGEGSAATRATMSDGLLEIAEAVDVPLVAQYLSEYVGITATDGVVTATLGSAKRAADRIAELAKLHKFTVEKEGDYLLAKSLLWHRLRPRELPEALIKKWQAQVTGLTYPTLETAVAMGALPWAQLRGLIANGIPWFGDIDLTILAQCEYALKLYASLSADEQRKALDAGGKVSCLTMNDKQRHLFMQGFEQRPQPKYDRVGKDWASDAWFLIGDMVSDYDLYAVAGMEQLATIDILAEMEDFRGSPDASRGGDAQLDYVMGGARKKLMAALAAKYPDLPPARITTYMTRMLNFRFVVGQRSRGASMSYSVRRG